MPDFTNLDPHPPHWAWTQIHLDRQLRCRVESTYWVLLWDETIPVLVCESTF